MCTNPCCTAIIERLSIHFNLDIKEIAQIVNLSQNAMSINVHNCLAKVVKGKTFMQCMRLKKKGHVENLCDAHIKKSRSPGGLTHGMFTHDNLDKNNDKNKTYADEDEDVDVRNDKTSIEVRLMIHKGREYLHDFVSGRIYDTNAHCLVGILTNKGVLEFDKTYLI